MAFHRAPSQHVLEELVSELQDYGLTRNEARVLTYLTKTGPSKASHIAQALKMNRTETYRTLKNLQRRGLVEGTLEHPVRFQAIPFEKCLDVLVGERESKVQALQQRGEELKKKFQSLKVQVGLPAVERFQVLEGRARIDQRLADMYKEAAREVDGIVSPLELMRGEMRGLFDLLKERAGSGLKVRLVTEITENSLDMVQNLRDAIEVRHLDLRRRPVPRVSIVDDVQAFFAITSGEEPHDMVMEEVGLWISSRPFVGNLKAYFEEIWEGSTPALTRIEALKAGFEEEDFKIIKGRANVRARLTQMLLSAKRSLDIWTTMTGVQILAANRLEELKRLRSSGVRIRVIAPITQENTESARKLLSAAELRHSEALGPARITMVDGRELLFYERIPDDERLDVGGDVGFWTNSQPFIEMMSRAYDAVWRGVLAIYAPRRRGSTREAV